MGHWVNCHIYSPFLEGSGLLDTGEVQCQAVSFHLAYLLAELISISLLPHQRNLAGVSKTLPAIGVGFTVLIRMRSKARITGCPHVSAFVTHGG